jgi:hypothetical protein
MNAAYQIDAYCSSNPECMVLHVASEAAVDRLADVLPSLAETGGYERQLIEQGSEILDFKGFRADDSTEYGDSWSGVVWHESNKNERIEVTIDTVFTSSGWELRTSTSSSRCGVGVVKTQRAMAGRWTRNPRPNIRRETAKAVANFLLMKCSAEAVAERVEQRRRRQEDDRQRFEHQVRRFVAFTGLLDSDKSEQELRAFLAERLAAVAGNVSRLERLIGAAIDERKRRMTEEQQFRWLDIDRELRQS